MNSAVRRLGPLDLSWLLLQSPSTPMHVGGMFTFTLPEDTPPDHLRALTLELREMRTTVPPWNLRLSTGSLRHPLQPHWVEVDGLDFDYHFRHLALPSPGGERELGTLVERLHSAPLDLSRPPWEVHLIEGLNENRFAVYFKIHHALIDGVSGMRMMLKVLSPDPDAGVIAPWSIGPDPSPRDEHPVTDGLTGAAGAVADAVVSTVSSLPATVGALARLARSAIPGSDSALVVPYLNPRSALSAPITSQRRLATQRIPLASVRDAGRSVGATVNEMVLWLSATALRRFLSEADLLPDAPLTAAVPVNLRGDLDNEIGTNIAMIYVDLATDEADPDRRLARIMASSAAGKEHLASLPRAALISYLTLTMTPFMVGQMGRLDAWVPPMFGLGISNVPGPDRPLYMAGARLEALYPTSLLMRQGALNITCVSYDGYLDFGVTGARDTLPHLQRLALHLADAAEEMAGLSAPTRDERRALE